MALILPKKYFVFPRFGLRKDESFWDVLGWRQGELVSSKNGPMFKSENVFSVACDYSQNRPSYVVERIEAGFEWFSSVELLDARFEAVSDEVYTSCMRHRAADLIAFLDFAGKRLEFVKAMGHHNLIKIYLSMLEAQWPEPVLAGFLEGVEGDDPFGKSSYHQAPIVLSQKPSFVEQLKRLTSEM